MLNRTNLQIAWRNMTRARRRTLLLGAAIAVVAVLFVVLRSTARSVSERMIESATTLSAGHVNVGGFFKVRRKSSGAFVADRDGLKKIVRETLPDAVNIIDRHRGWGRLIGPESSINIGVSGIEAENEGQFFRSVTLAKESAYKKGGSDTISGDLKRLSEKDTALLFVAQAKKLGVGVGDRVTMVTEATGGEENTVDLTVVAIANDFGFMSNWNIFVPRQTVLELYRLKPDTTGAVMVYLKDIGKATEAMEKLREALTKAGHKVMAHDPNPFWMKFEKVAGEDWLGQKIDLTIWSDEISFLAWVTGALDGISFFLVSVLGVIIGGGIANSMWMAVRERTKEIGTLRAIGAQKSLVVFLFMLEAVLIGVVFGAIGAALGAALVLGVNAAHIPITADGVRMFLMTNTVNLSLGADLLVGTVVFFGALTGLAAIIPSLKAAKLRPSDALMRGK